MTIQTVSRGSSHGEGGRVRVQACLRCPIAGAVCVECERDVWEHGGRLFTVSALCS